MNHELADLRATNNRMAAKRRRKAEGVANLRQRVQERRNRRRQIELLQAGVVKGWLR